MNPVFSRIGSAALLALSVTAACDSKVIVDNWGPSAGYARPTGTVTNAAGAPIAAAEVLDVIVP